MGEFDVAIIGMSGRFPGAPDVESYWSSLRAGHELISHFSRDEMLAANVPEEVVDSPGYVSARGVLDDPEYFDAGFFGFPPREAEVLDPQHRMFMECAWESLEDAGCDPSRSPGPIGVFAGVGMNTYLLKNIIPNADLVSAMGDFQIMALNDKDTLPSRVSYKLDLRGPAVDIQTSCSTGLVSVHFACDSLNNFGCDIALAGSVAVKFPQTAGHRHQAGGILSPDGHCRAFDAKAEGTIGGGGLGAVVLKRLEDALADGDRIHAVIRGSAVNNDGNRKVSYAAPSIAGQAEVIAAALAQAGVAPDTIGYVETHGTATPIGDPIEIEALTRAFRTGTDRVGYCAIGSVKTNIGHLDAAAGMAGLIKTVQALRTGEIPPSLHYERPNPKIDFESSPFFVNTDLSPWPLTEGPRRAGVSSFGVGGTNAHIILEEPPRPKERPTGDGTPRPQLFQWSAKDPDGLSRILDRFAEWLPTASADVDLGDAAHTLRHGRTAFPHRAALVRHDREGLAQALGETDAPAVVRGAVGEVERPDTLLMFPGQGTQRVALAPELYRTVPAYRDEVDRCCELLGESLGMDLREVLYPEGDAEAAREALRRTRLTQPAIFTLDYALAKTWQTWDVRPAALVGHSVGEYVAACLAGVFSLEDALRLVAMRGRLIDDEPSGAMLAVRLPESSLIEFLTDGLNVAAVNGPDTTVLGGTREAVTDVERKLAARDVLCKRLETSHAFHSPALRPAAERLEQELARVELHDPQIPIVSTVTGDFLLPEQARDPGYWADQMVSPVRFGDAVNTLRKAHPRATWLEVGPGRSLAGLVRPALSEDVGAATVCSLPSPDQGSDLAELLEAAGRLWVRGHDVDVSVAYGESDHRKVGLPRYPFARVRHWVDTPDPDRSPERERADRPGKYPNLDSWFSYSAWTQSEAVPCPAPKRRWLLFDDEHGVATRLMDGFPDAVRVTPGTRFEQVGPREYTVAPASDDDYRTLLATLAKQGMAPTGIMHGFGAGGAADFNSAQRLGLHSLLSLGRALNGSDAGTEISVWVLARDVWDVLGTEQVSAADSTVLGAAMVLPQECPWVHCGVVDIGTGDRAAVMALLGRELSRALPESAVAFRNGRRWIRRFEPLDPLPLEGDRVRPGGTGVVLGGCGGFGLLAARTLARLGYAGIVLVDCAEPSDEAGAAVSALEKQGVETMVIRADISDEGQLRRALGEVVERFGGVDGVIHAAGPEERLAAIDEADIAECETQFATKVGGLVNTDRVLTELDAHPDFAIVTSSLAAVLGGLGHTAYAAACAFSDAFARAGGTIGWQSVDFDTWNLAGTVADPSGPGAHRLELAMTEEETEEVLVRLLSSGAIGLRGLVVSTADLGSRIEEWVEPSTERTARPAIGTAHGRPDLSTPYTAPRTETESVVGVLWEELLGIASVGVHDNFFELGGDSLLAVRVASGIRARFRIELPLRKLFEAPTVAGITALIAESEADQEDRDAVAEILAELDSLPEDAARRQLRDAGFSPSAAETTE